MQNRVAITTSATDRYWDFHVVTTNRSAFFIVYKSYEATWVVVRPTVKTWRVTSRYIIETPGNVETILETASRGILEKMKNKNRKKKKRSRTGDKYRSVCPSYGRSSVCWCDSTSCRSNYFNYSTVTLIRAHNGFFNGHCFRLVLHGTRLEICD